LINKVLREGQSVSGTISLAYFVHLTKKNI
jgi:hypothetical protein